MRGNGRRLGTRRSALGARRDPGTRWPVEVRPGAERRAPSPESRAPSTAQFIALGFLSGLAVGALAWSGALRVSRRELFSASPLRRFAALSYLGGNPTLGNARVLRDYIGWETRPVLRRRAERLLRRVESDLT